MAFIRQDDVIVAEKHENITDLVIGENWIVDYVKQDDGTLKILNVEDKERKGVIVSQDVLWRACVLVNDFE